MMPGAVVRSYSHVLLPDGEGKTARTFLARAASCRLRLVRDQIEAAIRDLLNPLFAAEGGSIELVSLHDGLVQLRFGGTYRGCPSVSHMLSAYVAPALRQAVGSELRIQLVT